MGGNFNGSLGFAGSAAGVALFDGFAGALDWVVVVVGFGAVNDGMGGDATGDEPNFINYNERSMCCSTHYEKPREFAVLLLGAAVAGGAFSAGFDGLSSPK